MARRRSSIADLLREKEKAERRLIQEQFRVPASASTLSSFGRGLGEYSLEVSKRRQKSLVDLLDSGDREFRDLNPYERQLTLSYWNKNKPKRNDSPSFLGIRNIAGLPIGTSIANFISGNNEVGMGLWPTLKSLPQGIAELAKAVGSDVGRVNELFSINNLLGIGGTAPNPMVDDEAGIYRSIIQPTVEHFSNKYSGSPRQILRKALVDDPFGTLLDVATVGSLGTAGTVRAGSGLSRVGSRLAESSRPSISNVGHSLQRKGADLSGIMTTQGRAPIRIEPEAAGRMGIPPEIPRYYSSRPGVKATQKLTDYILEKTPIGNIPTPPILRSTPQRDLLGDTLRGTRDLFDTKRAITHRFGNERAMAASMRVMHSKPIAELARRMTDKERAAFNFAKNGINLQRVRGNYTALDSAADIWQRSLEGTLPAHNVVNLPGGMKASKEAVEQNIRMARDPEVRALIANPTENMLEMNRLHDEQVARTLEVERIDPEIHQQRIWAAQNLLRVNPDRIQRVAQERGISPEQLIADPRAVQELAGIKDPSASWQRHAAKTGAQIAPNYFPHMLADAASMSKKGRRATDRRLRKVDISERSLKADTVKDYLQKNEFLAFYSGAIRMDPAVLLDHIAQREIAFANGKLLDDYAEQFGAKITDSDGDVRLAKAVDRDEMIRLGFDPDKYGLFHKEGLYQFFRTEMDFGKILNEFTGQLHNIGDPAVRANAELYMQQLTDLINDSANSAALKMVSEAPNVMKAPAVIMPKTAINYIRETMEAQNKLGGVYDQAMSVWRSAVLALTPRWWINTAVGSSTLAMLSGVKPRHLAAAQKYGSAEKALELQRLTDGELRYGMLGTEHYMEGTKIPGFADVAFTKVENLEGFIRRAGFFNELERVAKQHYREMGITLENYQRGAIFRDEFIPNILENHPQLVAAAMMDTNRLFYHYNVMGAFERRYVRKFVPFWGWYKFITKLAWSLPAQYPAKLNVINNLGEIARDAIVEEYGQLPPTMEGAILLNLNFGGEAKYIPTLGLNPFGDFMNPADGLTGIIGSSQFAPLVQAVASGFGLDTYRGTGVQLSPHTPFVKGLYGATYDSRTGEEVHQSPGGLSRIVGGLARSVPQIRTLEEIAAGGRPVYPDSVPLPGLIRPLPIEDTESIGQTIGSNLLGGLIPRDKNLRDYQSWSKEDFERAMKQRKNEIKRLRKSGVR